MPTLPTPYEPTVDLFASLSQRYLGPKAPQVIVELGARDCRETLRFHALFPSATIYAFECNPQTLPLCRQVVAGINNIQLVEKAVTDSNGVARFFAIDPAQTVTTWADGNPGASSLLRASGKYTVEHYAQREIEVETTTLRDFLSSVACESVDLLWMDIQGAELMALHGLGADMRKIGLVHLEVGFFEIYSQQPLFRDIKRYLNQAGFLFVGFTSFGRYSSDAVFVNHLLLKNNWQLARQWTLDRLKPGLAFVVLSLAAILKRIAPASAR